MTNPVCIHCGSDQIELLAIGDENPDWQYTDADFGCNRCGLVTTYPVIAVREYYIDKNPDINEADNEQ